MGMNFSEALNAMKMGNRVSREAWRGKISFWCIPKNKNIIIKAMPNGKDIEIRRISIDNILADDWWIVT